MSKNPQINIIAGIGVDLEESYRDLINVIEQLRLEVNELQEWKSGISIE